MEWNRFCELDFQWVLDRLQLENWLQHLGFDPAVIAALADASARITKSDALCRQWEALVAWFGAGTAGPAPVGEVDDPLTGALAFLACVPDLFCRQLQKGIDPSVPRDSAADVQRWILNYRRTSGGWGLSPKLYGWLHRLIHEATVTIGRLQYNSGQFGLAHLLRCPGDGTVLPLAKDGLTCGEDGYPRKGSDGFTTVFSAGAHIIRGHPFHPQTGAIGKDQVSLPTSEWQLVLSPQSPVLFIHIPEGPGFTPEACEDSLLRARDFFPRYYPEIEWHAMACVSWLVCPELLKVTSAESNIASFVRRFLPLTYMNASDDQMWERVFGGRVDPESYTPVSSLQRSILSHVRQGGVFRTTGGYLIGSLRT